MGPARRWAVLRGKSGPEHDREQGDQGGTGARGAVQKDIGRSLAGRRSGRRPAHHGRRPRGPGRQRGGAAGSRGNVRLAPGSPVICRGGIWDLSRRGPRAARPPSGRRPEARSGRRRCYHRRPVRHAPLDDVEQDRTESRRGSSLSPARQRHPPRARDIRPRIPLLQPHRQVPNWSAADPVARSRDQMRRCAHRPTSASSDTGSRRGAPQASVMEVRFRCTAAGGALGSRRQTRNTTGQRRAARIVATAAISATLTRLGLPRHWSSAPPGAAGSPSAGPAGRQAASGPSQPAGAPLRSGRDGGP